MNTDIIYENDNLATDTNYSITTSGADTYDIEYYLNDGTNWNLEDTSSIIYNALKEAHALNSAKTNIAKTAFEIALKQLV